MESDYIKIEFNYIVHQEKDIFHVVLLDYDFMIKLNDIAFSLWCMAAEQGMSQGEALELLSCQYDMEKEDANAILQKFLQEIKKLKNKLRRNE